MLRLRLLRRMSPQRSCGECRGALDDEQNFVTPNRNGVRAAGGDGSVRSAAGCTAPGWRTVATRTDADTRAAAPAHDPGAEPDRGSAGEDQADPRERVDADAEFAFGYVAVAGRPDGEDAADPREHDVADQPDSDPRSAETICGNDEPNGPRARCCCPAASAAAVIRATSSTGPLHPEGLPFLLAIAAPT